MMSVEEAVAEMERLRRDAARVSREGKHVLAHNIWEREVRIQDELAAEFGRRHGWKLSKDFSLACLKRRGHHDATYDPHRDDGFCGGFIFNPLDHPYYFRSADRRAAAVAAHLYDLRPPESEHAVEKRRQIETAARDFGLRVSFPNDFPSWWVPGGTVLVLYQPGD